MSETHKASFVWSHLGKEVKGEISCQGIDFKDKAKMLEALQTTYGDQRPISSLSLSFHSTRQEGYEGIRQFSIRLHTAFSDPNKQLQRHNSTLVDETWLREQFVEGLRDEHLKMSLRQCILAQPQANFKEVRKAVLAWKPEIYEDTNCNLIRPDGPP